MAIYKGQAAAPSSRFDVLRKRVNRKKDSKGRKEKGDEFFVREKTAICVKKGGVAPFR